MQLQAQRERLIREFNRLFGAGEIAATADRLRPLLPSLDALEMVHRLDLLPEVPARSFLRYRDVVGIPPLHMRVLTAVLQNALLARTPVTLDIVQGKLESVSVTTERDHVAVRLVRTTVDPRMTAD